MVDKSSQAPRVLHPLYADMERDALSLLERWPMQAAQRPELARAFAELLRETWGGMVVYFPKFDVLAPDVAAAMRADAEREGARPVDLVKKYRLTNQQARRLIAKCRAAAAEGE